MTRQEAILKYSADKSLFELIKSESTKKKFFTKDRIDAIKANIAITAIAAVYIAAAVWGSIPGGINWTFGILVLIGVIICNRRDHPIRAAIICIVIGWIAWSHQESTAREIKWMEHHGYSEEQIHQTLRDENPPQEDESDRP